MNVDFSPTEDALMYFSITTGYRAGGFNLGYNAPTPVYDKEDITAFELGCNGQLLDGTLQINSAIYLYKYEGIALQFREDGGFFGPGTSVTNGPDVDTIGFEVDVLWLATDSITVGFNYSYTNSEYQGDSDKEIIDNTNPLAPSNPVAGTGVYSDEELKIDIDGLTVPRIPENKFTLWGEYNWQLGDKGKLVFLSTLAYTDEFLAVGRPRPETRLNVTPDYIRWDARATWTSSDEQWSVAAFVNNITDEIGIRQVDNGDQDANFSYTVEPTNPRWAGIELSWKFGAI